MCNETIKVICCNCTINDILDEFKIELEDLETPPRIKIIGYGEDINFICELCEEELKPLELYFENQDNFDEAKELLSVEIAAILSNSIEHCSHCDGQDIEDFEFRAEEEDIPVQIIGTDLYDFLMEQNLPRDFYECVLTKLRCSNCGYGEPFHPKHNPDGGTFEYTDKLYSSVDINRFWGFEEEFIQIAKDYGIEINAVQIEQFIDFCSTSPLMASRHEFAETLFEIVKEFYENKKTVMTIKEGVELFRGRNRAKDKKQYTAKEMGMPPRGVATHGRYNLIGTSVLYLTTNKNGVPYEIEPRKNEVVDIVTFVVSNDLKLLKVDEAFNSFSMYVSKENEESVTVKRNYLFTNFLASVCNKIGFDGIYYKGAGDTHYYNISLFERVLDKVSCRSNIETLNVKTMYTI